MRKNIYIVGCDYNNEAAFPTLAEAEEFILSIAQENAEEVPFYYIDRHESLQGAINELLEDKDDDWFYGKVKGFEAWMLMRGSSAYWIEEVPLF